MTSDLATSVEKRNYEFKTADDIFKCIMCGECCNGFGGTYITDEDIHTIASFINCDPIRFTAEFCSRSGSRYVLSQSETGKCIFFDPKQQCTIHTVKPRMCRNWPFIPTILSNPENWNAMANSCPGMKKNIPYESLIRIISAEIGNQKS